MVSETDVEYLFAKYHHLLGFEDIISWVNRYEVPDIIALKNGEETKIELESYLEYADNHYYPNGREPSIEDIKLIDDENGNLFFDSEKRLKRKSLKPIIDVIICWATKYKNSEIINRIKNDVQVIMLSKELPNLGISSQFIERII